MLRSLKIEYLKTLCYIGTARGSVYGRIHYGELRPFSFPKITLAKAYNSNAADLEIRSRQYQYNTRIGGIASLG